MVEIAHKHKKHQTWICVVLMVNKRAKKVVLQGKEKRGQGKQGKVENGKRKENAQEERKSNKPKKKEVGYHQL